MHYNISFPNLGIYLDHVGKSISIFGFSIAYYGMIIGAAILIGFLIATAEAKRTGQNPEDYLDMGIVGVIAGIAGARIYYVIFSWDLYKDNLLSIFNLREGGLAIYGGVIGAVRDSEKCHPELICDGVHIHPSVIRATFAMFGADRMILISDSMRATGLEDGEYTLGGQPVTVRGNLATLHDGTIAGSATNLMDCMRFVVKTVGLPLETAVMCATENPAKEIGIFNEVGSISVGKRADFVLLDQELNIAAVYIDGKEFTC